MVGYLVVLGPGGFVVQLFKLGPHHPEFQAESLAYKIGAISRELFFSAACTVAGISLFWHHAWGRNLALGLFVVSIFYDANAFAWGFSSGPPKPRVRLFSRIAVAAWNGMWFYLTFRLAL